MSAITISILISVAIGLIATLISGLIKLIFFFKQDGAYRHILRFGLIGEVVGLLIMFYIFIVVSRQVLGRA